MTARVPLPTTPTCPIRTIPLPKSAKTGTKPAKFWSTSLCVTSTFTRVLLPLSDSISYLNEYFGICVPVYPLVEEPVQAAVALQVHLLGHVLLGDLLERFGRGRSLLMGSDKVVHHVDECLVRISVRRLVRVHQGAQHAQDIRAFRVGHVYISLLGPGRDQPQTEP